MSKIKTVDIDSVNNKDRRYIKLVFYSIEIYVGYITFLKINIEYLLFFKFEISLDFKQGAHETTFNI